MIKYLELLLELLWTSDDEESVELRKLYLSVWKKQEERWNMSLKVCHKIWYVFSAYDDLWNDRISLDEFLSVWDITSQRKIISEDISSIDFLDKIIKKEKIDMKNTLIILDSVSFVALSDSEKNIVQQWTKENNNEMVLC